MASDKRILKEISLSDISVYAFVGAAGTGKSRRAQLVARDIDVDVLIDDGLVIRRGQIVCGKSAKAERNQIRAIRRALFQFEDHRMAVRNYLSRTRPDKLMLIATSREMATRITRRLGLNEPIAFIRIEEVASPEEISRARKERIEKGQHVIPVSHVQVRSNFAGQLVGKLRVLWESSQHDEGEKTIVRPPFSFFGELKIAPEAVEAIARFVITQTAQVASLEELRVRAGDEGVQIQLEIKVASGRRNIRDVCRLVQKRLKSSVGYFAGLEVLRVDVSVKEVVMP